MIFRSRRAGKNAEMIRAANMEAWRNNLKATFVTGDESAEILRERCEQYEWPQGFEIIEKGKS